MKNKINIGGSATLQETNQTAKFDLVRLKNPILANKIEKKFFSNDKRKIKNSINKLNKFLKLNH